MTSEGEHAAKPTPLRSIIYFKRWILRNSNVDPTTVTACASEVAPLLQLADYKRNVVRDATSFALRFMRVSCSQIDELWRRLVEARLFVEDDVNNAIEESLRNQTPGDYDVNNGDNPAVEQYWKLQCCILQLHVDVLTTDCPLYLKVCENTLGECATKYRGKTADIDTMLNVTDNLWRFCRFAHDALPFYWTDAAPAKLEFYHINGAIHKLQQMTAWLVRRAADSNLSTDKDTHFKESQLQRLLAYLFDWCELRSRHWAERTLQSETQLSLIKQLIPDNWPALLEMAEHVAASLGSNDTLLVRYLLESQRALFNAIPVEYVGHRTTMFTFICSLVTHEINRRRVEMVTLLRQHNIRFSPHLDMAYYGWLFPSTADTYGALREDTCHRFYEQVLAMVEFGMPLHQRWPAGTPRQWTEVPRFDERTHPCTLLEKLIVAAATAERDEADAVANWDADAMADYRSYPQSPSTTVWRFLIAERSPVPNPEVFGTLLRSCSLTALFTTLYCLFRGGKRVVLPQVYPEQRILPWERPLHYRKLAVIIHELLMRCGTDYPASFMRELDRIAGSGVSRQVDTLQMSALRVVRRHLSPSAAPSSHPRLNLDNYKELGSLPTFGELHFTKTPHRLIPPALLPQLNLTDLMFAYQEAITTDGAIHYVDLAPFDQLAG